LCDNYVALRQKARKNHPEKPETIWLIFENNTDFGLDKERKTLYDSAFFFLLVGFSFFLKNRFIHLTSHL
jgi:hypothetical protein